MKNKQWLLGLVFTFFVACSHYEEDIVNNWSLKEIRAESNLGELVFPVEDDSETWVFTKDGFFMQTVVVTHFGTYNHLGIYKLENNKITLKFNNSTNENLYTILTLNKNHLILQTLDSVYSDKYIFKRLDF